MIAGIVASQMLSSPLDVAGDVLMDLDFLAGSYTVGGTTKAAADVVDKPARIGASGLEILDNDADGVVAIISDALAVLTAAHWTLVLEYEEATRTGTTRPLIIGDVGDGAWIEFQSQGSSGDLRAYGFDVAAFSREADETFAADVGVHRVALTRTDAKLKMSVNGRTVIGPVETMAISLSSVATFGGEAGDFSFNGCFIRRLTVYDPQVDALLPQLSA